MTAYGLFVQALAIAKQFYRGTQNRFDKIQQPGVQR
jgi:hypothetical protein